MIIKRFQDWYLRVTRHRVSTPINKAVVLLMLLVVFIIIPMLIAMELGVIPRSPSDVFSVTQKDEVKDTNKPKMSKSEKEKLKDSLLPAGDTVNNSDREVDIAKEYDEYGISMARSEGNIEINSVDKDGNKTNTKTKRELEAEKERNEEKQLDSDRKRLGGYYTGSD